MESSPKHKITVNIAGAPPFKVPVEESEESFYRYIIERINENCNKFRYGQESNPDTVALAKVALYYATMLYRTSKVAREQSRMLAAFEARLDELLGRLDN